MSADQAPPKTPESAGGAAKIVKPPSKVREFREKLDGLQKHAEKLKQLSKVYTKKIAQDESIDLGELQQKCEGEKKKCHDLIEQLMHNVMERFLPTTNQHLNVRHEVLKRATENYFKEKKIEPKTDPKAETKSK